MSNKQTIISFLGCMALLACFTASANAIAFIEQYPTLVPDTGQIRCYDTQAVIPCPVPGEDFYGQDANYSINATNYSFTGQGSDEIIKDQITGLSWQRSADTSAKGWSDAIDYTAGLTISGLDGWRLPSKQELQSILNFGNSPGPLAIPFSEEQTRKSRVYAWTISNPGFPSLVAKSISLTDNQGALSSKNKKHYVYGVRGESLKFGQYEDNNDRTVTDQSTGLTWQSSEMRPENWKMALAYCEDLVLGGYDDWRLPSIRELMTLVNEDKINPAIDSSFFPSARSAPYWASTTFSNHPGFAWYVRFNNGLEYNGGYKQRHYFVRAVRGGIIAAVPPKSVEYPRPVRTEKKKTRKTSAIERKRKTTHDLDIIQPAPLDYKTYE